MGHLINPISTRLGFTSFWVSTWSSYSLNKFSYNLMVDNILRKFILWSFSSSKMAIQLSTVGVFLSHFKIIRRNNKINIFVFLILNSSKILQSQSIETNPTIATLESELVGSFNNNTTNLLDFQNSLLISNSSLFVNYVNKELLEITRLISNAKNYYEFNATRNFFISFALNFFSINFTRLFKLNSNFSKFEFNLNTSFLKTPRVVNSRFLSRFIARRLSFGFELNRVLNPIVLDLTKLVDSKASKILGFRIACSGRFNKTQMASYTWEKYGPIPLNNFSSVLDYSFSKVFMRYGLCGIKVWVFTSHRPFKSFKSNILKNLYNRKFISNLFYSKKDMFSFLWLRTVYKSFFLDYLFEINSNKLTDLLELSFFLSFFNDSINLIKLFKNVS